MELLMLDYIEANWMDFVRSCEEDRGMSYDEIEKEFEEMKKRLIN